MIAHVLAIGGEIADRVVVETPVVSATRSSCLWCDGAGGGGGGGEGGGGGGGGAVAGDGAEITLSTSWSCARRLALYGSSTKSSAVSSSASPVSQGRTEDRIALLSHSRGARRAGAAREEHRVALLSERIGRKTAERLASSWGKSRDFIDAPPIRCRRYRGGAQALERLATEFRKPIGIRQALAGNGTETETETLCGAPLQILTTR